MAQELKRITKSDPRDITDQLRKRFYSPDAEIQARKSISPSEAVGSAELAYYRGRDAGIFDAYLTLRQVYPEAANALLKAFNMRYEAGEWEISL